MTSLENHDKTPAEILEAVIRCARKSQVAILMQEENWSTSGRLDAFSRELQSSGLSEVEAAEVTNVLSKYAYTSISHAAECGYRISASKTSYSRPLAECPLP